MHDAQRDRLARTHEHTGRGEGGFKFSLRIRLRLVFRHGGFAGDPFATGVPGHHMWPRPCARGARTPALERVYTHARVNAWSRALV
eukprot:6203790-Pleurochrysis_carterae.AAC.5